MTNSNSSNSGLDQDASLLDTIVDTVLTHDLRDWLLHLIPSRLLIP